MVLTTYLKSVYGEVGDVVGNASGNRYLITEVIPIHGFIVKQYKAIDLDGFNTNVTIRDCMLVCNYGRFGG